MIPWPVQTGVQHVELVEHVNRFERTRARCTGTSRFKCSRNYENAISKAIRYAPPTKSKSSHK